MTRRFIPLLALAYMVSGCQTPIAVNLRGANAPVMLGPVRRIGGQPEPACKESGGSGAVRVERSSFSVSILFLRGSFSSPDKDAGVRADSVSAPHEDSCVARIDASAREMFVPALFLWFTYRNTDLYVTTGVPGASAPQAAVLP